MSSTPHGRPHRIVSSASVGGVSLTSASTALPNDPSLYFMDVSWLPSLVLMAIMLCGTLLVTSLLIRIVLTRRYTHED
jgi:hypothetical protein